MFESNRLWQNTLLRIPNVTDLLQERARIRPPQAGYFTIDEILAGASTVRPEPYGSSR
ncbi:MAG: hypothetical protein OEU80_00550 [Deltaproteobacteria bacterium]|nr:hypothetical protein [Deltaproteobacteria bacterium]MDH3773857.1 hypothetical protein [Deltaproteobacteria bacterium]MDH3800558.1 hypothetical protein [Deltaproteobacteria bacterium]MDH3850209.1 hypothetical protein [Deltaproteobacteria bacterium]MDH3895959.1 hypothetical protein [Deltaproteobacteria bacterium]